jgi:signal transduction histidine kinase/ligand-binding sensor domain-containing protein
MRKSFFRFLCCWLVTSNALAQNTTEVGYQFVDNYSPKEYGALPEVTTVLQNEKGIMYFGNGAGLLEFDGSRWRTYQLPKQTTIHSLAIGEGGKIYVGSEGEIGYFLPDASGKLTYHTLMDHLPKDKLDFGIVFHAFACNGKVYFNAVKYIFTWNIQKQEFSILESANKFHIMFMVDSTIYIREWNRGLEELQGDSVRLIPGSEKFANERIYTLLPFPGEKGTLLIVTRTMGLFKYDGKDFIPFKTASDQFMSQYLNFNGMILSDGDILLGTFNGGAIVIDRKGKEIRRYNRETGVINNTIDGMYQDAAGGIWLATGSGISRVDYASPVTYFGSPHNFSTSVNDLLRHKGIMYVATNEGVYSLDPKSSEFRRLLNVHGQTASLLEFGNELLLGTHDGLYSVDGDKILPVRRSIGNEYVVQLMKRSIVNPNRIFVSTFSGIWSVLKKGNQWIDEGKILDIDDAPWSMVEEPNGDLYAGTPVHGLFRLSFHRDGKGLVTMISPIVKHFDSTSGLEKGEIFINFINGRNYFFSNDSVYNFDEHKKTFYIDSSDKLVSSLSNYAISQMNFVQQDSLGRIWMATTSSLSVAVTQPDGSYQWVGDPFNNVADQTASKIYTEKNGMAWIATSNGLDRYDFTKKNVTQSIFPALLRSVTISGDSTIYFGDGTDSQSAPKIGYLFNALGFTYAATLYEGKTSIRFKTFLDGFNKNWSPWSAETKKDYTNLPPGKYTFRIVAKNESGIQSSEATYSFEILPPWYRTWWAYCLYFIAFVVAAMAVGQLLRQRVIAKERQLSEFREAKLKAEAENEQRRNIELIGEMGKDITASLSIGHIIDTVYAHVNKLMDASIFGIGIVNKEKQKLEFPATKEKGQTLPAYSYFLNDTKRPASWCFNNRKEIFMNDFEKEHQAYISDIGEATEGMNTESIIYLPLIYKDKSIGVITAQSFNKKAYNHNHLNILRNLATYTAVALDNAEAYRNLQSTQAQLVQSEKMASLGELTAGIAHEIQNPLNFVNNFSEVNKELLIEMKSDIQKGNYSDIKEIMDNLISNEEKIFHHGRRADTIVKGMLQHSRSRSGGQKELTGINALADEYLRISYHGMRSKDNSFNVTMKTDFDQGIEKIHIIPQDIGRVLLNIYNNAFFAVHEKKSMSDSNYQPMVVVSTKQSANNISISVTDNGIGIPEKVIDKIFQPFFTTKPAGQGTGLGLSLSYDIIKAHGGEIRVETTENEGTAFIIELPLQ